MSQATNRKKMTIRDIAGRKGGEPIVCLTTYSAALTRLIDPHADLLLVGDSLATAQHGFDTTVQITLDQMIFHTQSAMRAGPTSVVIVDMPFGCYEASPQAAFASAARIMKETGADGVKLEGGEKMAPTIRFLTENGIPVLAHIGLLPQSINATGGYRVVGRSGAEEERLRRDAKAIEEAGAFAVVMEGMVEPVARHLTGMLKIPTIGIGASSACDGQVLVTDDLLGLFDWTPKFVRRYANLRETITEAVAAYAGDVRSRSFPAEAETYPVKKD